MILDFHPIGNMFFKQLAKRLAQRGLLSELRIAFQHSSNSKINRILPGSLAATLSRRALPEETLPFAKYHPWRELGRVAAIKMRLQSLVQHETGAFCVDKITTKMDAKVARALRKNTSIKGVYAYEDGAAYSFQAAKDTGKRCFYDLPIGYWRAAREIMLDEAEREPEWASTIQGNDDSEPKTDRKDLELALADDIFVASTFTRKTLELAPALGGPIHIVPYGSPGNAANQDDLQDRPKGKLRILYVGSLGQRKGISYLKKAVEQLEVPHELTIIGSRPSGECKPLDQFIKSHRYIPSCPHEEVLKEMRSHHVFVFPSLFEGFGLVLLEAMSQGMAVITTPHTAGPDIITDGKDGFIVPIRDSNTITSALTRLHDDFDLLESIGEEAIATSKRFTWDRYGDGICDIIEQMLSPSKTTTA